MFKCLATSLNVLITFLTVLSSAFDRVGPGTEAGIKAPLLYHLCYVGVLKISVTLATLGLSKRPGPLEDPGDPPTEQLGHNMLNNTRPHLKRLGGNMFF